MRAVARKGERNVFWILPADTVRRDFVAARFAFVHTYEPAKLRSAWARRGVRSLSEWQARVERVAVARAWAVA